MKDTSLKHNLTLAYMVPRHFTASHWSTYLIKSTWVKLYEHAIVIDFLKRKVAAWEDIEYFVTQFKPLLQLIITKWIYCMSNSLTTRWLRKKNYPVMLWKMQFYKDGTSECRNDVNWYHLRQIRSPIGNNFRFNLLFKVAQIVMLITHSNAGNRLDSDWILSASLSVKLAQPESQSKCFDYQPTKTVLENARKATVIDNEKLS